MDILIDVDDSKAIDIEPVITVEYDIEITITE